MLLAKTTCVPTRLGSSPHLVGSVLKSPCKGLAFCTFIHLEYVQGRCTQRTWSLQRISGPGLNIVYQARGNHTSTEMFAIHSL